MSRQNCPHHHQIVKALSHVQQQQHLPVVASALVAAALVQGAVVALALVEAAGAVLAEWLCLHFCL